MYQQIVYSQEFAPPHSFFSGDNVTFIVCISIGALLILTVTVLGHIFGRHDKDKEITIAQIQADAQVKVAEHEALADIEVAKIEAQHQLPSSSGPDPE